jgi:hypothetical protein
MLQSQESEACTPITVSPEFFNPNCILPYDLKVEHIYQPMKDFVDFLGLINLQLHSKEIPRLESFLMPANFSSIVGEFMNMSIPKYCSSLVKNLYHNGHPDLIPRGMFLNDAVQYAPEGIEIKG